MTHDPVHSLVSHLQAHAELELLDLILEEASPYPWNPGEPAAEAYFATLEQEVVAAGWSSADFAEAGQRLAATLDQLWADASEPAPVEVKSPILNTLFQQFTAQVPQQILDGIIQRAKQVMNSRMSVAEQLIFCVQDCLPNWAEEDLQVLARPFAYAMRGTSETAMVETALRSVRCADWIELAEIEQARVSLAIARYAIAELPKEETQP